MHTVLHDHQLVASADAEPWFQRNWICKALVILSYTCVFCCAQGWCLWLSCMFWVNCSLLFRLFYFFSLDILILALGDPMYKASLNICSPRVHLATYGWAVVGCAAVSADIQSNIHMGRYRLWAFLSGSGSQSKEAEWSKVRVMILTFHFYFLFTFAFSNCYVHENVCESECAFTCDCLKEIG